MAEAVERVSVQEYFDWLRYWKISPPLTVKLDVLIQVCGKLKKPVKWYEAESDKAQRAEMALKAALAVAPKRTREEVEKARNDKASRKT